MTPDLILVRHGVTDWNEAGRLMGHEPIALNARGRSQAEATARALAAQPLGAVVASPQRRTQETAAIIAAPHGLAVTTDDALAEVWFGPWVGRTFSEIIKEPDLAAYLQNPLHACDAFEPTAAVHARVVGFLERFRAASEPHAVVAVSHGDPLRILLAEILGMPLTAYRRLVIDPGSVTIVRFGEREPVRLLVANWFPQGPPLARLDG